MRISDLRNSINYIKNDRPARHALNMSYPFCSLCPQEQSGKTKSCEIEALRAGRSDTTNLQSEIRNPKFSGTKTGSPCKENSTIERMIFITPVLWTISIS